MMRLSLAVIVVASDAAGSIKDVPTWLAELGIAEPRRNLSVRARTSWRMRLKSPVTTFLALTALALPSVPLAADQSDASRQTLRGRENPTDVTTRLRSWEQHQRMERESPFADLEWRAVGPQKQGGRIESIAVPAGETSTFYVGVGSGNLWKTVNNGTTWTPIFEKQSAFAIGDVAVAESDPNVVWVATGEVLMARSSYAGTGVFKSVDAGETWQHMGLADTHHIGQVLIHPSDPDIVYVAAIGHLYTFNEERGLFKTVDGGDSWEKILYINNRVGVVDLVMDPSDPNTLYATAWERTRKAWGHTASGEGSGIYKTTDGGNSWEKLTNGFPTGQGVGRIAVDVAPSNPNVVYALLDNHFPDPDSTGSERGPRRIGGEVYRSDDRGATWRKVNEERVPAGYDFCIIKISPDNEDVVYLPGQRFLASEDGGKTYRQIEGTLVHLLPHGSRVLHLDQHELWINPQDPDHMLLGNDGGIHLSYDRGESWLHLNNLPIGEFYAVSVDMETPYNIYGGTQDAAALWGPSTHVVEWGVDDPWKHVYLDRWGGGDSYFTYRDPTDPDVIYYEHQFGDLRRKEMAADTAPRIRPRAMEGQPALRPNWMTPFFISHYDPRTLYYGANILFKSVDRGDTWRAISPDLTSQPPIQGNVPFGTLTSVSESPLQRGLLYTGADDGYIHVTRDDGATWARIDGGLPQKWVSRVAASRYDLRTVYVSFTGYRDDDFEKYVYRSTDLGESWVSISANLPSEPINVIAEDPTDARILYVGTDLGVYASVDGGATWHSLCADLPTAAVYDLVVHPRDPELVIGTHGRSIFVADITMIREAANEVK